MDIKSGIFSIIVFLAGLFFGYSYFELEGIQKEYVIEESKPNIVINKYVSENRYSDAEDDTCTYAFSIGSQEGKLCVATQLGDEEQKVKDLYNLIIKSVQDQIKQGMDKEENSGEDYARSLPEIPKMMKELDDIWWKYKTALCYNETESAGSGTGYDSFINDCEIKVTKEYYKHLKMMQVDWME